MASTFEMTLMQTSTSVHENERSSTLNETKGLQYLAESSKTFEARLLEVKWELWKQVNMNAVDFCFLLFE